MAGGLPLFRTWAKRSVLIVLVVALAGAAALRLFLSDSETKVDPATAAKAEQIRSELMDYSPPENNVPDRADPVAPGAPQHPSRQPRPKD